MNIKHTASRRNQKGVTLIELLLGLVIILIVIGVGVAMYTQANTSASSYSSSSSIMNLSAAVKSLHPRPNYAGLTAAMVATSGKAPANMVAGTTLLGQWGGLVTLQQYTFAATPAACAGAGPCNAFEITYPNVPKEACTDLVVGMQKNFDAIYVGTTMVKNRLGTAAQQEPTTASIITACGAGSSASLRFISV